MARSKRTTYIQALEASWPRGRYLVGLLDGLSLSKKERTTVKALRTARTALQVQIDKLTAEKEKIESEIREQCSHPPEHLSVEELPDGPDRTRYSVECSGCFQTLRRHVRTV